MLCIQYSTAELSECSKEKQECEFQERVSYQLTEGVTCYCFLVLRCATCVVLFK